MDPEAIQAADDPVELLRRQGEDYTANFPVVPNEHTNWRDEQRAITETATLADLSHHMTSLRVSGPDARALLAYLSVNDFDDFPVGRAKQVVMCSPNGHLIGDGPLLRLAADEFYGPGVLAANWVRYHVATGDWDVEVRTEPRTSALDGDPERFVYQVQGPEALAVLERVTDASLADIGFYRFQEVDLAGVETLALGHGMSTEPGFEFIGPFEHADAVRDAILDAGADHGLRRLGSKAYHTLSVKLGWLPPGVPPIYDVDDMAGYREWLDADSREATYSIDGSFDSDDVTDYYFSPVEVGYGPLVDLDHDFVGRDVVAADLEEPPRSFVTLHWDDADVIDVYASLFRDGDPYKFMELPRVGWGRANYDRVERDDELVGLSHSRAYQWDLRSMVSLARLDPEHADPGTEVTLVWGEGDSPNPKAERHVRTAIRATVGEVPYSTDRRGAA
ncbi:MAG: aminomethyl transferase family protein [Halobacteriales archaeon]